MPFSMRKDVILYLALQSFQMAGWRLIYSYAENSYFFSNLANMG